LTLKQDIEKKYDELLSISERFDSTLEVTTTGWVKKGNIKTGSDPQYWESRNTLELELPLFMGLLRKAMNDIPSSDRRFVVESNIAPDGEEYTKKVYSNETYGSLVNFFDKIQTTLENPYVGVITGLTEKSLIKDKIRDLRGYVLSYSNILDLFAPENVLSIEKEVEITLKLREKDLGKIAEELEGITEEDDNLKRCLRARVALEQIVLSYCEKHSIKPTNFFFNLDSAIKIGLTDKAQEKAISGHYSFVSKIIHKDIEANPKNTLYAVNGVYNIIGSIVDKFETPKDEAKTAGA
jgi:hypothetical protein